MMNTKPMNVVVGCMIIDGFVQAPFDLFQVEGIAGFGSCVATTMELWSWQTPRMCAVSRSEDSLATEISL